MLNNTIGTTVSCLSNACYATAAVLIGSKVGLATICKIGGVVTGWLGNESAEEWNQSSEKYWDLAKKNLIRDLTATGAFLVVGMATACIGKCPIKENEFSIKDELESVINESEREVLEIKKNETSLIEQQESKNETLQLIENEIPETFTSYLSSEFNKLYEDRYQLFGAWLVSTSIGMVFLRTVMNYANHAAEFDLERIRMKQQWKDLGL